MKLSEGFRAVALKLQEQATELSQHDICRRLGDALSDYAKSEGCYCYVVDVFGDDQSGDLVYSKSGDLMKAPYSFSDVAGTKVTSIDFDSAVDVVPRTTYEEEPDEDALDDQMASMESQGVYTKGKLPLCERYISQDERSKMDKGDFAGKGTSFPIKTGEDVTAAVRSMGRAGSKNLSMAGIKKNIISIAKRKGLTKFLPKSWRDDSGDNKESTSPAPTQGTISLNESASTLEPIILREAKADYEIKLIAPGKGSSAFYPREVLQRDGPKVFRAGTHVYLNHPTAAEEAARPEGDVKNLAGVLTTDAAYTESHPKGEGLYARMKVFADHATVVEEKAPHVGMSIRASGRAESGGKTRDGLPVLAELTSAESVDVVTRAGAGGMILTEAAKPQEVELTLQEAQKMIQDGITAQLGPLRERALKADAREEAEAILESVTLPPKAKARAIESALKQIPKTEAGELDREKFREVLVAEAKREGQYLAEITGSGRVFGMGPSTPTSEESEAERKRLKETKRERKEERKEAVSIFESLGMPKEAAKLAAKGRVA